MKNLVIYGLIILSVCSLAGCQKELEFEPGSSDGLAKGSLKSDAIGTCLPSLVNGTYVKDNGLTSANYIEVTANITSAGNYIIKSDTVAGFSFIGIGSVTSTGINLIRLLGEGAPTSTGIKTFTIKFDTSVCKININVTTALPPNAVFSFGGAPGICSGAILGAGTYTAGNAVGPTNTVMLNVTVTGIGLYSVNTGAAVNGLTFNASGSYNGTGPNTLVLTASGIPTAAGTFLYTISNGTSSCTFSIVVTTGPPAVNLDYIPQTSFTNWSTKLVGGAPSDTTYTQVSPNSKTFGANSYKIFEIKDNGTPTDSLFNRKNGGLYFQYIDGDLGALDNPINKEYLVLDSTKTTGGTWLSPNLGPNSAGGIPITSIIIAAEILGKGETQTIASIVYNNVIRVKYTYTVTFFGTPTVVAEEERWFARGIGVIYSKINNILGGTTIETELTRSQIF